MIMKKEIYEKLSNKLKDIFETECNEYIQDVFEGSTNESNSDKKSNNDNSNMNNSNINNENSNENSITNQKVIELKYAIPKIPKTIPLEIAQVIAICFYVEPRNRPNVITLIDKFNGVFKEYGMVSFDITKTDKDFK